MRVFFLYVSTLAFLLTELYGLIQGAGIFALLGRSIAAGGGCFILGSLFSSIAEGMNSKNDQESENAGQSLGPVIPQVAPQSASADAALRTMKAQPREAARYVDALLKK